jgi:hypothetical protein
VLRPALIGTLLTVMASGCTATPEYRLAESSARVVTHCLATGTHIVSKDRNCPMPAGRSYSKEDIANSGAGSTAQALWKLDPAISLGGHHR